MKAFVINADFSPKEGYVLSQREKDTRRALRGNMVWNHLDSGLRHLEIPKIGDDEVLIQVGACGICGSDLHMIEVGEDGYTAYSGHTKFPVISGHEFSGEVVEIGSKVTNVKVGDLIAVEEMQWCGECPSCRVSKFNQCQNLEEIGITRNGGFCEYEVIKAKYCCVINDIAAYYGDKIAALELGALAEPTCVAYSGMVVNGGGVPSGQPVVVFGAGPIGLASIAMAKACGAGMIIAFNRSDKRLPLAKEMGADYVFSDKDLEQEGVTAAHKVMELTHGLGAKMIVETTGAFSAVYPEITQMLGIECVVVQLGMSPETAPIDLTPLLPKNARIQGSLGHAGSGIYPAVLNMMAAGRLDMRKMVTGRYSLDDIETAFKETLERGNGKTLVSFRYGKEEK